MALVVKTRTVIVKLRFINLSFRISHLATNPVNGGIPAKLAIVSKSCHLFDKLEFSSFMFLRFILFKYVIMSATVLQYKKT